MGETPGAASRREREQRRDRSKRRRRGQQDQRAECGEHEQPAQWRRPVGGPHLTASGVRTGRRLVAARAAVNAGAEADLDTVERTRCR